MVEDPRAVLLDPVLRSKETYPNAVLFNPVVFRPRALVPIAVFRNPVVLFCKAPDPTAVISVAVLSAKVL